MKKFDEALYKLLCAACSFLMFCMVTLITTQVVFRYAFHNSLTWSEELGRYIFVWLSFLGMAAAFKKGSHVSLDILMKKLQGVPKKVLIIINGIILTFMSCAIIYSGIALVKLGTGQTSAALKLPINMVYFVVPFSGAALLYFILRHTWLELHAREEDGAAGEDELQGEGSDAA